jgi:ABC-type amino acid transport substrate-binding protein
MKTESGSWEGISIGLWKRVADDVGIPYRLIETDLEGLLEGTETGELDAALAALTITAAREKQMDFSHPFHSSGLSMAVARGQGSVVVGAVKRLFSPTFLKVVGGLAALLLIVGILVWLTERKRNAEQFGGGLLDGIGSGFWWSAVTMTTVGYGDKAPRTFWGRFVGLIWMFAAIITISTFTASISAALTITQLGDDTPGPKDLPRITVGTIPSSTSESYLAGRAIEPRFYQTVPEGLAALSRGDIEAFVYDRPILRYHISRSFGRALKALPVSLEPQDYGIALPSGSALREPVNRALLGIVRGRAWQDTLRAYLGEGE